MPDYLLSTNEPPSLPEQIIGLESTPSPVSSEHFLTVSPKMQAFVDSLNLQDMSAEAKVNRIYKTLFYHKGYIIDYEMFTTLTAAETFEQKRGNCVSLTAMMVALGRAAGLNSQFRDAHSKPLWQSQNGVLTKLSHVNTLMHKRHQTKIIVDFNNKYYFDKNSGTELTDNQAQSIYFNNLGSEALIKNDLSSAYYYYRRAIVLAPQTSEMWNNMGALLNRLAQYELSESVLEYAASLDNRNYGVLINLQNLYGKTGRPEAQRRIQALIHTLYAENPHYMKSLAERALMAGDISAAMSYIEKANKLRPNLIDPNSIYLTVDKQLIHYQLAENKFTQTEL